MEDTHMHAYLFAVMGSNAIFMTQTRLAWDQTGWGLLSPQRQAHAATVWPQLIQ